MSFLISSTGRLILFVCVLGMGLQEAWSQNIWFVSPVDGEVVRPGETIPIILGTDPALGTTIIELSGTQGSGYPFVEIAGPPFETSFTVPLRNVGPNTLLALGWAASPEDTTGYTTVTVQVIPAEPPVEIFFLGTEYSTMTIPLSSPGGILSRLSPMGRYSDGTTRALSHPSLGTTYSVSDPGVASVDEEGRITPLSPGVAIVTVQNGPTVAYAGIQVRDAATGRIPTVEVTDQVSIARSGFRFNPANNTYVQKITVTNLGSLPLAQPLRKLPSSGDGRKVELSGMLSPGGSDEEVTIY